MWRELFDKEPPGFSRNYLISGLAYRIQELGYGGFKPATRAGLDALADGLDPKAARKRIVNGPVVGRSSSAGGAVPSTRSRCSPTASSGRGVGTSRSQQVARAITGTRWNGPVFFGLRGGRP
jgi:hypothetical protein